MAKKGKRLRTWQDVLRFYEETEEKLPSRSTVKRNYHQYLEEKEMPRRCENRACCFHTGELVWNGEELRLTLDHINGVARHNRPKNLRLLCPNCASQTPTHGGKNKGRVKLTTRWLLAQAQGGEGHHARS